MSGEVFIIKTTKLTSIYAAIAVTYPSGSICTCNSKAAKDTTGYALFPVEPGTYTIECHTSDNSKNKSTSVTITENDKRYHCGNIQNESQLEKEVQKIIPEFKIHKIETKICTKCNLRDTRKPIIFNENNFVTVFGGKITNIFELLDKIQKI